MIETLNAPASTTAKAPLALSTVLAACQERMTDACRQTADAWRAAAEAAAATLGARPQFLPRARWPHSMDTLAVKDRAVPWRGPPAGPNG